MLKKRKNQMIYYHTPKKAVPLQPNFIHNFFN
jgi:hypothetical protein